MRLPSISVALIFTLISFSIACRSRIGATNQQSGILESRAPGPGETVGRFFMDATTFAGTPAVSAGRDGVESEVVKSLQGLDTQGVIAFANFKEPNAPRTAFQKMAKPGYAKAFVWGVVPAEKVPWTKKAHEMRETSPYIALSVEPDRVSVDAATGEIDVSVGTDFMIDAYYDTPDFLMLENGMTVRSRNRQDLPGVLRRVLIQSKVSKGVDSQGLKLAQKRDIREDTTDQSVLGRMDDAVKSGKNILQGQAMATARAMDPLFDIYTDISSRNVLPDLDGHSKVLLLNKQAMVVSTRGRYHMRATSSSAVTEIFNRAPQLLQDLAAAVANDANAAPDLKTEVQGLATSLKDPVYIATAALAEIQVDYPGITEAALTPYLTPAALPAEKEAVKKAHHLYKTRRQLLNDFSKKVSFLSGDMDIKRRQLEASGSAGLSLWYTKAASAYGTFISTSDFLIDTFDYCQATTVPDFDAMTPDQKSMKAPLPPEKVFFASLVNEVQIELWSVVTFQKCIDDGNAQSSDPVAVSNGKMCKFLLDRLNETQEIFASLRGDEVRKTATSAGLGPEVKWVSGEASKGENVLRIARVMPAPAVVTAPVVVVPPAVIDPAAVIVPAPTPTVPPTPVP